MLLISSLLSPLFFLSLSFSSVFPFFPSPSSPLSSLYLFPLPPTPLLISLFYSSLISPPVLFFFFSLSFSFLLSSSSLSPQDQQLQHYDFSKFPSLKMKLIESVDKMLASKIAVLMAMIREEESKAPPAMVAWAGPFEGSTVNQQE
ncbi:hypothetical protein WMY93_034285 [Mugilogobius chulae]|uniref:DUF5600 domain-containing protein n=1 Tax=Mugilogobius chulae TaxID=88201 RepID=A0AAW0MKG0_9GOBI